MEILLRVVAFGLLIAVFTIGCKLLSKEKEKILKGDKL